MSEDAKITNSTNTKQYLFYGIKNWTPIISQGTTNIPLPESSPSNTQLIRTDGMTEEISFDFLVFDNGIDRANGTHTSEIKTVADQISYLRSEIYTASISDSFTLTETVDYPGGVTGVITKISFSRVAGDPNRVEGQISFIRGTVIG